MQLQFCFSLETPGEICTEQHCRICTRLYWNHPHLDGAHGGICAWLYSNHPHLDEAHYGICTWLYSNHPTWWSTLWNLYPAVLKPSTLMKHTMESVPGCTGTIHTLMEYTVESVPIRRTIMKDFTGYNLNSCTKLKTYNIFLKSSYFCSSERNCRLKISMGPLVFLSIIFHSFHRDKYWISIPHLFHLEKARTGEWGPVSLKLRLWKGSNPWDMLRIVAESWSKHELHGNFRDKFSIVGISQREYVT